MDLPVLFGLSLFAEFLANDRPVLVKYRGELRLPVFQLLLGTAFGGDLRTEADIATSKCNA